MYEQGFAAFEQTSIRENIGHHTDWEKHFIGV